MKSIPAWVPTDNIIAKANISQFMAELGLQKVKDFHQWTIQHYQDFWLTMINKLGIVFQTMPIQLGDFSQGLENPQWFPGAKINIVDSCFTAPATQVAIVYQDANKNMTRITYGELNSLSNRIANSLTAHGFLPGDAIGIVMPMNMEAIAIYLGIIKMGGVVVSIADSFSSKEMETRFTITNTKAVFTQDFIPWMDKKIPLYEKVCQTNVPIIILFGNKDTPLMPNRKKDIKWLDFLSNNTHFKTVSCDPMQACHILFSSGTTSLPKAIPWNHTTPIKVASDAYFHQNIQRDDILAWPTNLGWMMGPWLVFAAFINQASIAVYTGAPKDRAFGEFIQHARVTMLGLVPTLVASWKESKCMENLDWSAIKVFSSSGECSNADDMRYLMKLGGNKPIIEYCGGTEIGGAYISSTVIEDNYPTLFSTPTMGLAFTILDENRQPADIGEVAIIPPSIGLSTTLLNADHHHVYFENMPTQNGILLRRHGDQIIRLPNGYFSILGRMDDTMKLGGIKISATEIERAISGIPHITELAAIAVPGENNSGPSRLIIYAVATSELNKQEIQHEMQKRINQHLNPLFKIYDIVLINELPKTASNKIMRRLLRDQYIKS